MLLTKELVLNKLDALAKQADALANSVRNDASPDLRPLQSLGVLLAAKRRALNKSPPEIAAIAGISPGAYRKLEAGEGDPRLSTITSVCKVLNLRLWVEN